jgi:ATP-binding cassette subfamily B protein
MFTYSFFRSPTQQRQRFMQAAEFAPLPLDRDVRAAVDGIEDPARYSGVSTQSRVAIVQFCLTSARHLIQRTVAYQIVSSVLVLFTLLLSRKLLSPNDSLTIGLVWVGTYIALRQVQTVVEYFESLTRIQVNRCIQSSLYGLITSKILSIDLNDPAVPSGGALRNLFATDVEAVEDFLTASIRGWTPGLITLVLVTPVLAIYGDPASLPAILVALGIVPITVLASFSIERLRTLAQSKQDHTISLVGEWVRNVRLLRFLNVQTHHTDGIKQSMRTATSLAALQHFIAVIIWGLSFSWWVFPLLTLLAYADWHEVHGSTTASIFLSFWLLDFLMEQLRHLPYSLSFMGAALSGLDRIVRVCNAPEMSRHFLPAPETDRTPTTKDGDPPVPETLSLTEVQLKIGDRTIIKPTSISLNLRETTAIVGKLGCGKSLLLSLLAGERPPSSGALTVSFRSGITGQLWRSDIHKLYRSAIAFSPQQPYLSNATLLQNIALGDDITLPDVQTAIEQGQLSQDIAELPRGIQEEVGETGINLSGGQRQRVSLCRAFLSKRPLFIFDDPLSAVDRATEESLMDEIQKSGAGLVITTHRLDKVFSADRILVMEDGSIVEDGPPRELVEKRGKFVEFLEAFSNE